MKQTNARKSLDHKLNHLIKGGEFARPHRGWIKAVREALGMTTAQLARRIGVSQPRITELEQAEIDDKITLGSLRRAAEALNCTLVYAIVPNNSTLENIVLDRARKKATKILAGVNHTMALEDQNLSDEDIRSEIENLAHEIIVKKPRIIWDEKP